MRRVGVIVTVFFVALAALIAGCSDRLLSFSSSNDAQKKSLAEASKLRARAIGNWSPPTRLGSASIPVGNTSGYFHGPELSTSRFDETFVGWRVHDALDPQTGQFLNGLTTILHTPNIGGVWQPHTPIPPEQRLTASIPSFVFNDNLSILPSGWNAAAIWGERNNVYASVINNQSWSVPYNLGAGRNAWLMVNAIGILHAISVEQKSQSFAFHVARFMPNVGWTPNVAHLDRPGQFQNGAEPRADGIGNLVFAWSELTPQGALSIRSTRLNANGFFENPFEVKAPSTTNEMIPNLFLALNSITGDAELVYLSANGLFGNGLFSSHYSNGVGWQAPRNIDGNLATNDKTHVEAPGFATNNSGDVVLAWVEDQTDGQYNYSGVYAAQYSSSTGWQAPQPVSPPALRGPVGAPPQGAAQTLIHSPVVAMRDGAAAVAWIENSPSLSELFVSTYSTARGYGVPELVTSILPSAGYIEAPQTQITSGGFPIVAWRQMMLSAQAQNYDIMLSAQGLQGGTVITPVPIDPSQPKPANHIASSNNCFACHTSIGTVVVDHTQVMGSCASCHNGFSAAGKTVNHLPTTDLCERCHNSQVWRPVTGVDHTQVVGVCASCHNGITTVGKSASHIATSNECQACHLTFAWRPVLRVDHSQVMGACINCHNGSTARGKKLNHIFATDSCFSCHNTLMFKPVMRVDHTQVIGTCLSCHNNAIARGKTNTHIPSPDNCEVCHTTNAWRPAAISGGVPLPPPTLITRATPKPVNHIPSTDVCEACHLNGSPIVARVDHAQVLGACMGCHNNQIAPGKPPAHPQTTDACEACHATAMWIPYVAVDHTQVIGECVSCHNGINAIGKTPLHKPTTDNCAACHSITNWSVVRFDHTQAMGPCTSCHNNKPANHIPTTSDCGSCHNTINWRQIVNNPPPVVPAATWSAPVSVWNDVNPGTGMLYVHGPEIVSSPFGDSAISFVKHSQFNGLNGSFQRAEPSVYWTQPGTQQWAPALPASTADMSNSNMVQVKINPNTGIAYALWAKNGGLYFSQRSSGQQWSPPQMVGSVDGYYQLADTNNASAIVIIWRSLSSSANATIDARAILSAGVLAPIASLQVNAKAAISEPYTDFNGNVHLGLVETVAGAAGSPPMIQTRYARYSVSSGWSNVDSGPAIGFATTAPVNAQMLVDKQNRPVMIVSVTGANGQFFGGVYSSTLFGVNNWSPLKRIDDNANGTDFIAAPPVIAANSNRDAIIVWSEGVSRANTAFDYHVYSSRLANDQWTPQVAIGNSNDHFEGDPAVVMSATGNAYVTWTASIANNSVLYVKRYTPQQGWDAVADIVASTDLASRGMIQSPSISFSPSFGTWVSWKEFRRTEFNTEHNIWVSGELGL